MALGLDALPIALFLAACAALAATLLAVDFQNRANRAFALFLGLRAAGTAPILLIATGDPGLADYGTRLLPYFFLLVGPAALLFAAVYPRPRAFLGGWRSPSLPFLAAMAALVLVYMAQPQAFRGGQLSWLVGAYTVVYGLVALRFLRDAAGPLPEAVRRSAFLVALGFAVVPLWQGPTVLLSPEANVAPGVTTTGAREVALVTTLVAAGFVAAVAWLAGRHPEAALRRQARRGLVLVGVVVATVASQVLLASTELFLGFAGVWRLALPLLVCYAMLRHQLFGLDLKVKWTIRQSTIAAAFVGVFFVASESATTYFATDAGLGPYLGVAAAGVLVFLLAPLQRAAERVANAAVPDARAPEELAPPQRLALYRAQVEAAWADGALSRDERRLLEVARAKLGIGAEDALRIEREAAP